MAMWTFSWTRVNVSYQPEAAVESEHAIDAAFDDRRGLTGQ